MMAEMPFLRGIFSHVRGITFDFCNDSWSAKPLRGIAELVVRTGPRVQSRRVPHQLWANDGVLGV